MFDLKKNASVFDKKISRLFVPYFTSSLCSFFLLIVDSIVAGVFIGQDMLSAVSLMAPIFLVDEMLHNLFGLGVARIMSRIRISKGVKVSNEFIGAVLIAVFSVYAVVVGLLLIFSRQIIEFYTSDEQLVSLTLKYYYPVVAAMPFFEMLLCLENSYTIDGRPAFFASVSLIRAVLNLVLDILFVTAFSWGVYGLAWASVLSTLIGYAFTIFHGVSAKCTVRPDFSVVKNWGKMKSLIFEDINIGKEYLIQNIISIIAASIINKKLGTIGVASLAIWYIVSKISDILFSLSNSMTKSLSMIEGILLGENDFEGIKKVLSKTLETVFLLGLFVAFIYLIFAPLICRMFGMDEDTVPVASFYLRISLLYYPFYAYAYVARNHLITIGKTQLARIVGIWEQALMIPTVLLSSRYFLPGIIIGEDLIYLLSFVVLLTAIRKNNAAGISPEKQPELLSFYIKLADEQIVDASRKSYNCMMKNNYDSSIANAVSLTIEECCLLLKNADKRRKNICAYIRLVFSDNKLVVTVFSDGAAVNILELTENITSGEMISERIIKSKTDFIHYQRIIEMNYVKLCVKEKKIK